MGENGMGQAMARLVEVMYTFWASLYLGLGDRSHCIDSTARYAFLDYVISSSLLSESESLITLDSGMGMTPR